MHKVIKTPSAIVHKIAYCVTCGWTSENYIDAHEKARKHTEQTGHQTSVEVGTSYHYKTLDKM